MKNNEIIFTQIGEEIVTKTSHGIGLKMILMAGSYSDTNITQVAFGEVKKDEIIPFHIHQTMEEFYFFLEGEGVFLIENKSFICKSGGFLKIPSGMPHSLKSNSFVRFLYWGIAL